MEFTNTLSYCEGRHVSVSLIVKNSNAEILEGDYASALSCANMTCMLTKYNTRERKMINNLFIFPNGDALTLNKIVVLCSGTPTDSRYLTNSTIPCAETTHICAVFQKISLHISQLK